MAWVLPLTLRHGCGGVAELDWRQILLHFGMSFFVGCDTLAWQFTVGNLVHVFRSQRVLVLC